MAALNEIAGLWADDGLKTKVEAGMTVIAKEVEDESDATTDHAKRLALAKSVYANPQTMREQFLRAMVAANADQDTAVILAASDTAILQAIRDAWNTFLD